MFAVRDDKIGIEIKYNKASKDRSLLGVLRGNTLGHDMYDMPRAQGAQGSKD